MGNWVFIITDTSTGFTITQTVDNPLNWDKCKITKQRDKELHGIFTDYSFDNLEFSGDALDILENAYNAKGIQATTTIQITWDCDTTQILYEGNFNYHSYRKVCSYERGCYISIQMETPGALMKLRNRMDQKVNLDTTVDFAGNAVTAYSKLGNDITLEPKAIQKTDEYWIVNATIGEPSIQWDESVTGGGLGTAFRENFTMPFGEVPNGKIQLQEFRYNPYDNTSPVIFTVTPLSKHTTPSTIPTNQIIPGESLSYNFEIDFGFKIDVDMGSDQVTSVVMSIIQLKNGAVSTIVSYSSLTAGIPANNHFIWTGYLQDTWVVSLNKDDNVTYYLQVDVQTDKTSGSGTFPCELTLLESFIPDYSFLKYSALSTVPSSTTKSYMINEALSRVSEAITDSELRVVSDYFGRTDSQPYAQSSDGCGSLECITKGLLIRQALIQSNEPIMSISLKDLFDGLNGIHCLGMGLEADDYRYPYTDYQRLRIEPFEYFYQDTILMTCLYVNTLEVEAQQDGFISTFKFGYNKYEGEEYNGIDEFLTKRDYRSELSQNNKTLDVTSDFIASGYAIEITRMQSINTKDWRFDNDTFIICLERDGSEFIVEQGNIILDDNIIDPPTIYNYRISPLRNALRWAKILFAQQYDDTIEYKFTSGTGNYFATGVVTGGCVIEREFAANSEMGNINYFTFGSYIDCAPIWKNERVNFTYPMTAAQYDYINDNPYGKIGYSFANGDVLYGWIDKIVYEPNEGMATFTLIPVALWK